MSELEQIPVHFRVSGMDVPEFVILRLDVDHKEGFDIQLDAGYVVMDQIRIIQPQYRLTLLSKGSPFLMVTVVIAFEIEPESWVRIFSNETRELVIPMSLASHLGVVIVGAMRGVLFERLRRTPYADLVLPTVNISDLTNEHRMVLAPTPHG